jgi:hypothetical protein
LPLTELIGYIILVAIASMAVGYIAAWTIDQWRE